MPLTFNQFLFLVLTFAAVIVAVYIIRFLAQLRRVAREGEKTMVEVRKLAENLNELESLVKDRLVGLGELMEASKKTAVNLSEASYFLTTKVLRPSSKFWTVLVPAMTFVWRQYKKRKEKKNGG